MNSFPKLFILGSLLLSSLLSAAQSTKIIYKKRGGTSYTVVITLTDNTGNTAINPLDFKKLSDLYFTITPDPAARRQYFKENDITDFFSGISIEQDNHNVGQSSTPGHLTDNSGKIASVIISFPKADIKLYEPFVLVDKVDTTSRIVINERFYPSFEKNKAIFEEARFFFEKKDYIKAFNTLYQIEKEAQANPEIKSYSFYKKAAYDLPKLIINNYSDSLYKQFLKQHELFQKKKEKPTLDSCHAILQNFQQGLAVFQPYLQITEDGIPQLKAETFATNKKMATQYNADKLLLKQTILALLETGNYSNYKFFLFVDVLNRMLCTIDSLKILNGIPLLDINILNRYPEKTNEMVSTGWFNEFRNLTDLLNDNIKNQDFIFDKDVLSHLKLIDSLEREPYFEIFSAFNSLDGNFQNFYTHMNRAIVKCTDSLLLSNLDLWMVSYRITYEQPNKRFISEINKGIKQIRDNQWPAAENTFNIIKRQTNTLAVPWFYSAVVKFHEKEFFAANAQFNKSLALYPHYLAPRMFLFKNLLSEKRYADLLVSADSAISSFNIWYFHYIKAFSLLKLHRGQDCINELLTQCIPMNSWNLSEYFLMGDAYLTINDFGKAKEAYLKTREIDPYANSKYFNDKMQNLFMQQEHHKMKPKAP